MNNNNINIKKDNNNRVDEIPDIKSGEQDYEDFSNSSLDEYGL